MLTRFAPAPTGWLHLGHVVNAIYVWGLAAAHGAHVLLRIEDHDRQRSRAEYERGILDDLDWLGFRPDVFPTSAFRAGACVSRQQDRLAVYERQAAVLVAEGAIYGCVCSRRQQAGSGARNASSAVSPGAGSGGARNDEAAVAPCPGDCHTKGVEAVPGRSWRLRVRDGVEPFDDLLSGPVCGDRRALGDVVVRDRYGNWTYQFAVAVDDFDQQIDLVVRGRDLLDSTAVQIDLARRLGRQIPARFAHHPLLMKSASQKLSKSDRDTGVRDFAARGLSPAHVIGQAAAAAGLIPEFRPFQATDVVRLFA